MTVRFRHELENLDTGLQQGLALALIATESLDVVCRCERIGRDANSHALAYQRLEQFDAAFRHNQVWRLNQHRMLCVLDGVDQLVRCFATATEAGFSGVLAGLVA